MACLTPARTSFTNRPVTDEGEFVDNHKVWTIHSVAYDNTSQLAVPCWSATSSASRLTSPALSL